LTFIPMGLVLVEPDLGTAMLFLPTLFAMLIAAGAKIRHLVIIVVLGLSLAPAMYPLLQPHQKDRIQAMLAQVRGDERYVNDIGYQGARAMTLVGAGQLTGVGRQKARELAIYNHLPESHNDMIFAIICCRWGMVGALVTWALFAALCLGGVLTAALCKEPFGRLVAVGLTAALFAQVTINNGMTIGLMPITGMTLPFVSYGGSSLVTVWLMIGLLFNIALRRPQYLTRHSFEFDEPVQEDRYTIVTRA
jgi:cell division protein FtsW (lipid II flippase)